MNRTTFRPMKLEEMEAAWGGPLPELEPIYLEMAKDFSQGRPEMAPYVMKKFFTLEEAQIAMQLPGTAEEVAQKLDMDLQRVTEVLEHMYMVCKVIKNSNGYIRHTTIPFFRNTMYTQTNDQSVCDRQGARLFNAWDATIRYEDGIAGGRAEQTMRIVPKWEAIKNIPGVMPCENLPQMLREKYDAVRFKLCPCREVTSYAEYGVPYKSNCRTGIKNNDVKRGVCIGAGKGDEYYDGINCSYHPTHEELEEHIRYIESLPTYYMVGNDRNFLSLCCCCDDCDCGVRRPYERGNMDFYVKSRFISSIAKLDKCDGCGKCEEFCAFNKSIRVVNGKPVVNAGTCHGCGICVTQCDRGALKMKLIRPVEHIPEEIEVDMQWLVKDETLT